MTREEAVAILMEDSQSSKNYIDYLRYVNREEEIPLWMDKRIEAINVALAALQPWVRTADRAPTMEDADAWDLVFATHRAFGGEPYKVRYQVVANNPSDHVWWMPIPPLPEVEE